MPGFNSLGRLFRSKYGKKNRETAKRNADKRCGRCDKKSGSSGRCFPAGTPVHTADGLQPIEEVHEGDLVWSLDVESGEWHLAQVLETYEIDYEGDLVTLELPDETLMATGGHPFWVLEGEDLEDRPVVDELVEDLTGQEATTAIATETGRWVSARDLQAGDIVLGRDGERREVLSTEAEEDARLKTYNLLVERLHTYAVGIAGIVVHNNSPLPRACKKYSCDKGPILTLIKRCKGISNSKKLEKCDQRREELLRKCARSISSRRTRGSQGALTAKENENCPADPACCDPAEGYQRSTGTTPVTVTWYNGTIMRADGAEALVTPESVGTGSPFNRGPNSPGWWSALLSQYPTSTGGDQWQRGHLIGNQLGGPGGSTWWNMVPLHRTANDIDMKPVETRIRKAAEDGECVKMTVTASYQNRKVVPSLLRIVAKSETNTLNLNEVVRNRS